MHIVCIFHIYIYYIYLYIIYKYIYIYISICIIYIHLFHLFIDMFSYTYPQEIKCFETHPSITTIKRQGPSSNFNFQETNANKVMKVIG